MYIKISLLGMIASILKIEIILFVFSNETSCVINTGSFIKNIFLFGSGNMLIVAELINDY